jgi:hypothetical protein
LRSHIPSNPSHPNNDWFEELCALAAIGELSSGELQEFGEHQRVCSACRDLYADFGRIASDDMAAVAVQKGLRANQPSEFGPQPDLDEEQMLGRLLQRAAREEKKRSAPEPPSMEGRDRRFILRFPGWLKTRALTFGVALILPIIAAGVAAHQMARSSSSFLEHIHAQLMAAKRENDAIAATQRSTADQLYQTAAEKDALQKALVQAEGLNSQFKAQREVLVAEVAAANVRLESAGRELSVSKALAEQRIRSAAVLDDSLRASTERLREEEKVVAALQQRLQVERDTVVAANPAVQDGEAKELFGARDLHIIDVYDVDAGGNTRRTFGRVYYVEKKLLVFYAFDLQDKRHSRVAAGFQAWGYSQGNALKSENLGLFYVDDASLNRWALKVKDRKILERIDAVFVTLEPPGGSPEPRGRKLLYANLSGPPNHP